MEKIKVIGYIIFIVACLVAGFKTKDVVVEDKEHQVICIATANGRIKGCMDTFGNQVSNTHINHSSWAFVLFEM